MGAAIALGLIGDKRAFQPLIESLRNDCAEEATIALGMIGDPRAVEHLFVRLGREMAAHSYGDSWCPINIIRALSEIRSKKLFSP
jgi:hypothetical protein